MNTKTNTKSCGMTGANHNESLLRPSAKRSLKVGTSIKAGLIISTL